MELTHVDPSQCLCPTHAQEKAIPGPWGAQEDRHGVRLVQALEEVSGPLWQKSLIPRYLESGWGWSLGSKKAGLWGILSEGAVQGGQHGLSCANIEHWPLLPRSEDSYD